MSLLYRLKRDIRLFLESPIEYIYSYTYSGTERVKIDPFDPEVKKTGERIVERLKNSFPELKVHFVGSPVFEVPGQRDVDLYVECDPKEFDTYLPKMTELFGAPQKSREKFQEWHFIENGCDIEIMFGDPSIPNFKDPVEVCEIIGASKENIEAYRKLKERCNGLTFQEYKRERLAFFNKLLKK